jgi:hypothetical protein
MKRPKMLTLTLRRDYEDLPASNEHNLNRLLACRKILFKKLRALGYDIDSWFCAIELPVHLHLIMDSDFIDFFTIKRLWKQITGDSDHVYIKALDFHRGGYHACLVYVVKYLGKSIDSEDGSMSLVARRHMIQSYGLPAEDPNLMLCDCGAIGRYTLLRFENVGDSWASFVDKDAVRAYLTMASSGPPR